jgi:hypothetical protein
MEFINTYTIDFDKLENVNYKEVEGDWDNLICENEGSFSREDQAISFDVNGSELLVCFELNVSGSVDYDPGDYWTPSYTDVDITDVDVYISNVYLNDYDLPLDKESIKLLENKIQKMI